MDGFLDVVESGIAGFWSEMALVEPHFRGNGVGQEFDGGLEGSQVIGRGRLGSQFGYFRHHSLDHSAWTEDGNGEGAGGRVA